MKSLSEIGFTHSPVAQLLVDPQNDTALSMNHEARRLLKLETSQSDVIRVSDLFSPSYIQLLLFTEEALCQGKAWSNELLVRSNHEELKVEASARSVNRDDKALIHLCIQDANTLKNKRARAEAQHHYHSGLGHWNRVAKVFREFERENQLILDAAGEGIYGVDTEGVTTFINPAAERILGYKAKELAGKNMHLVIHHSHCDGTHFGVHDCPIYQAFRDGIVRNIDNDIFWTKSGKALNVEYTSTPIKDNGKIVGAVVIFRDVTQKIKDKERLVSALKEVERLKQRLELENAYLQEELNSEFNHHQIVGKSPAVQKVIQQIELVAATDATVLISGESGTGKELIARAIHDLSQRNKRSLIRVNCAAIPAELFESEFFGHTKGAFSGAVADRPGRFELADGGTIFLDEVGEIPLNLQGKLLRVLQEQQFERVGESTTRQVNVRIIAATNRDLMQLVKTGDFREDLYFRLNVFPIESVPLRERVADIPLLAQHFLNRLSSANNKHELRIPLSEIEKLKQYHWPGNIREMENIIERQIILAKNGTLRFNDLHIKAQKNTSKMVSFSSPDWVITDDELKQKEKRNMLVALKKCQGKVFGKDGAAQLLGLKPTTLASRIKKYKIDTRQFKNTDISH